MSDDALGRLNLGWRKRLPIVLQSEASECALACLAMISQFHGDHTDLASLRRRYGVSLKGANLKEIISIAERIGFAVRPLRLDLEELSQLRLPCILHWDLSHFVVLQSVGPGGAVIHDPSLGVRRLSKEAVSRSFTGIAIEFTPTKTFESAAPPPRVRPSQLLGRIQGIGRSLGNLFVMALVIEIFALIGPLLLGWTIDQVLVSADRDLLVTLVFGFALLLLLQTAVSTLRAWTLMGMGASLKVQSRANLFTHLISLPTAFFETRHLGDVMSRFGSQDTILKAITSELVEVVLDGLLAAITLVIMYIFAPMLASLVLGAALIYAALRWASYARLRQASSEAIVWSARRDSHFLETLRGIRTIKLFNGQGLRQVHWMNLTVETVNRQLTTEKLRLVVRTCNRLLLGSLAILVIWLGALKVLDGSFSVGFLLAFIAYKDQFISRVSELINKTVELKMLRLHAERLADLALTAPEPRSADAAVDDAEYLPAGIELRDVSFRYAEQDPWVLQNVSLRVQAGESVAIVGPSGCGKSTLLKLIAGLTQPTSGEIFVNGEPIHRLGLAKYRAMLGVVMQDDQLFAGSIADNIAFFSDGLDMERVRRSAELAAVHDDIAAMPMAYGTLIGDMGTVLSGGQKQRVLLARALYRRPAVLLLDEATSHLDIEREKAVNDALRNERVTRIVIAHRPETIRASGRTIALEGGRVAGTEPPYRTIQVVRRSVSAAE